MTPVPLGRAGCVPQELRWCRDVDPPVAPQRMTASGIGVDNSGNLYVVGTTEGAGLFENYFVEGIEIGRASSAYKMMTWLTV